MQIEKFVWGGREDFVQGGGDFVQGGGTLFRGGGIPDPRVPPPPSVCTYTVDLLNQQVGGSHSDLVLGWS